MTIHPETETVGSAFDPVKRVCTYTIERGGRRWTVAVSVAELDRNGPVIGADAGKNKLRRRAFLAGKLEAAMQGAHDGAR